MTIILCTTAVHYFESEDIRCYKLTFPVRWLNMSQSGTSAQIFSEELSELGTIFWRDINVDTAHLKKQIKSRAINSKRWIVELRIKHQSIMWLRPKKKIYMYTQTYTRTLYTSILKAEHVITWISFENEFHKMIIVYNTYAHDINIFS